MPTIQDPSEPTAEERRRTLMKAEEFLKSPSFYGKESDILLVMVCLHLLSSPKTFTVRTYRDQLIRLGEKAGIPRSKQQRCNRRKEMWVEVEEYKELDRDLLDYSPDGKWGHLSNLARNRGVILKAYYAVGEDNTLHKKASGIVNNLLRAACASIAFDARKMIVRKDTDGLDELNEAEKISVEYGFRMLFFGEVSEEDRESAGILEAHPSAGEGERDKSGRKSAVPTSLKGNPPPQPVSSEEAHAEYLRLLVSRYDQNTWTRRQVRLCVSTGKDVVEASAQLMRWAQSKEAGACFLVGDLGSGKTGLAEGLASELARQRIAHLADAPLPLVIKLLLARQRILRTVEDVLTLTSPAATTSVLSQQGFGSLLVVLDGLDELLDPSNRSIAPYTEVLSAISGLMPADTKYLVTCRAVTFDPMSPLLQIALGRKRDRSDDEALEAITKVLELPTDSQATVLRVRDVDTQEADRFFRGNPLAYPRWEVVREQATYQEFARRPFTLQLLDKVLPGFLTPESRLTIADLYERAIVTILFYEWRKRHDEAKAMQMADRLLEKLENVAADELKTRGDADTRSLFVRRGNISTAFKNNSEDRAALILSGLLRETVEGELFYAHYSYGEYFIARRLYHELATYQVTTLRRLNLVGAYGINRLLVPLLWTDPKRLLQPPTVQRDSPPKGHERRIRVVSRGLYRQFLRASKWRENADYGVRPTFHTYDGRSSVFSSESARLTLETEPVPNVVEGGDDDVPITGISWYDAFQFCRWYNTSEVNGARFLAEEDIAMLPRRGWIGPTYVWGGHWLDEEKAHMAVVMPTARNRNRAFSGVNPDFRHSEIGLCVSCLIPENAT